MAKRKAPRKMWVYVGPKRPKPVVPPEIKIQVQQMAEALIETIMKPEAIKPPAPNTQFNYIVNIYGKWYRNYYYFCAEYHCSGPDALSPSFEAKFTRMEYVGDGNFNLAYMRHTGQWWELFRDQTLETSMELIKTVPTFHIF